MKKLNDKDTLKWFSDTNKKGLLLENEEGNFVQSPRFQKKK